MAAQKICIPELLEMILLQLDMRTLLVSAQRVCRAWHTLIKDSSSLQTLLFFKPATDPFPTELRARELVEDNPLLSYIWHEFWRKRVSTSSVNLNLPQLDPQRQNVFLREEASWRQMLLRQPPVSLMAVVEKTYRAPRGSAFWFKEEDKFTRLGYLYSEISRLSLIPGRDLRSFYECDLIDQYEKRLGYVRARVTSCHLPTCAFVIYCHEIQGVTGEPYCRGPLNSDLELWLGNELGAYIA
ncbi:F-box protein [Aspergillus neoniger CBS 115656]|uniref:F-box domain-containing protein n=1 Tax=Aspergillus neoniger (strain CBS 115656) TaxID=1448310 RepID=A0A318YEB8_ASPNB|nr:hypothetical protein BO87DRAFT_110030 [Aspergillus neoniger CBS 115656]PYH32459.1 hypothetical protein BO87DRAFT_110030 [Aspergillus neoniger CBS 115656]